MALIKNKTLLKHPISIHFYKKYRINYRLLKLNLFYYSYEDQIDHKNLLKLNDREGTRGISVNT